MAACAPGLLGVPGPKETDRWSSDEARRGRDDPQQLDASQHRQAGQSRRNRRHGSRPNEPSCSIAEPCTLVESVLYRARSGGPGGWSVTWLASVEPKISANARADHDDAPRCGRAAALDAVDVADQGRTVVLQALEAYAAGERQDRLRGLEDLEEDALEHLIATNSRRRSRSSCRERRSRSSGTRRAYRGSCCAGTTLASTSCSPPDARTSRRPRRVHRSAAAARRARRCARRRASRAKRTPAAGSAARSCSGRHARRGTIGHRAQCIGRQPHGSAASHSWSRRNSWAERAQLRQSIRRWRCWSYTGLELLRTLPTPTRRRPCTPRATVAATRSAATSSGGRRSASASACWCRPARRLLEGTAACAIRPTSAHTAAGPPDRTSRPRRGR